MQFSILEKTLAIIKKSSFLKNFSITLSGTTLIFLIQIITTPIISRIYSPLNYGEFALFSVILANVSAFSMLGFQNALLITKSDEKYWSLSKLIICLCIIVGVTFIIVITFWGDFIIAFISNKSSIDWWMYLIPLLLVLHGIGTVLNNLLVKKKKFSKNIMANVYSRIAARGSAIGFGFVNLQSIGLIIGESVLMISMVGIKTTQVLKEHSLRLTDFKFNFKELKKTFNNYINYPKFVLPSQYIYQLSSQLPILYISAMFGVSQLGSYTFASSIINIPIQLFGNALRPVFFQHSNEISGKGDSLFNLTKKVLIFLIVVGLPVFTILVFFGEEFFVLVFGKEWKISGEIASILSVYLFLNFLSNPIESLFYTLKKEKILLKFNFFNFLMRGLSLVIPYILNESFIRFIWYYTITNFFLLMVQFWLIFYILKSEEKLSMENYKEL